MERQRRKETLERDERAHPFLRPAEIMRSECTKIVELEGKTEENGEEKKGERSKGRVFMNL